MPLQELVVLVEVENCQEEVVGEVERHSRTSLRAGRDKWLQLNVALAKQRHVLWEIG